MAQRRTHAPHPSSHHLHTISWEHHLTHYLAIVWLSFGPKKGRTDGQMICQMNSGGGGEWKWREEGFGSVPWTFAARLFLNWSFQARSFQVRLTQLQASHTTRPFLAGNSQGRERKKHTKKTHIRISEGVREGVWEGGFGAWILYAGVVFPSKTQCIKNFKKGGLRSNFGGSFLYVYVLFRDLTRWSLKLPIENEVFKRTLQFFVRKAWETSKRGLIQGRIRYHKKLVWQRFRRTLGWAFWCDLPQNPCFTGWCPWIVKKIPFGAFRAIFWLCVCVCVVFGPWLMARDVWEVMGFYRRLVRQRATGGLKGKGSWMTSDIRRFAKGWFPFPKGWFWYGCSTVPKPGTRLHSDVPLYQKPGTRAHSPKPPFVRAKNGIPKNLSSQVFGEVRVNFLVWILTKTLYFMCRRPELFRTFLGSLRMILCYCKTFSVPNFCVLSRHRKKKKKEKERKRKKKKEKERKRKKKKDKERKIKKNKEKWRKKEKERKIKKKIKNEKEWRRKKKKNKEKFLRKKEKERNERVK